MNTIRELIRWELPQADGSALEQRVMIDMGGRLTFTAAMIGGPGPVAVHVVLTPEQVAQVVAAVQQIRQGVAPCPFADAHPSFDPRQACAACHQSPVAAFPAAQLPAPVAPVAHQGAARPAAHAAPVERATPAPPPAPAEVDPDDCYSFPLYNGTELHFRLVRKGAAYGINNDQTNHFADPILEIYEGVMDPRTQPLCRYTADSLWEESDAHLKDGLVVKNSRHVIPPDLVGPLIAWIGTACGYAAADAARMKAAQEAGSANDPTPTA